jgi:peptidoglycan/LPS O-acetylase OafA/YrhL
MQNKTKHIAEIDTFRAWAVIAVLLFHYFAAYYPEKQYFLIRFGWTGVDLFFVISGFVMYLQLNKKYIVEGKPQYKKYLINRFLRIAPAFYVSVFVSILIFHREKIFSSDLLMHLSFTHILSFRTAFGRDAIQPLYWSLGTEMQFYIFLILLAPFLNGKKSYYLLAVLMFLSILYRYIIASYFGLSQTGILLNNQLPGRLPQFLSGIFLAALFLKKESWKSIGTMSRYIALLGFFIYLACALYWLKYENRIFENPFVWTFFMPVLGLAFAMIMTIVIDLQEKPRNILKWKPAVFIGTISFSIYLWHMFMVQLFKALGFDKIASSEIKTLTAIALVLILSTGSYYLIEKQFLKLKIRS